MPHESQLLTPAEASAVSGVPVKAVYKLVRERLPRQVVVRRAGKLFLTHEGAVCVRLDRQLPRDVPVAVRRALYHKVKLWSLHKIEHGSGPFRYVLDPAPAEAAVAAELAAYRKALAHVVEDPEVQGGAATFKGTRILVHHIADLVAGGVTSEDLLADYPNLTHEMIRAAPLYARTHPKRGRPKAPAWRGATPISEARRRRGGVVER
jgi:uncharacterized protein (DUF433 family)